MYQIFNFSFTAINLIINVKNYFHVESTVLCKHSFKTVLHSTVHVTKNLAVTFFKRLVIKTKICDWKRSSKKFTRINNQENPSNYTILMTWITRTVLIALSGTEKKRSYFARLWKKRYEECAERSEVPGVSTLRHEAIDQRAPGLRSGRPIIETQRYQLLFWNG